MNSSQIQCFQKASIGLPLIALQVTARHRTTTAENLPLCDDILPRQMSSSCHFEYEQKSTLSSTKIDYQPQGR